MSLNVLTIGGSRNIGYLSSLRLLESGSTVTFLLRSPSSFDADEHIQKYVQSGKAHLVKGDALIKADVQRSWDEAGKHGPVDLLLFTVGGVPSFHLTKGFVINPPNLVTQCLLNALSTMPTSTQSNPDLQPRVVVITSTGLSKTSRAKLPFALKPLYSHFLGAPHKDKLGAERVVAHCAGWSWNAEKDGEPGEEIMGSADWRTLEGLPSSGSFKRVLVIRPALLTDGECRGDKVQQGAEKPYRVTLSEEESKCWTISRNDVAHFIVDAVLNKWDQFENKCVSIAY